MSAPFIVAFPATRRPGSEEGWGAAVCDQVRPSRRAGCTSSAGAAVRVRGGLLVLAACERVRLRDAVARCLLLLLLLRRAALPCDFFNCWGTALALVARAYPGTALLLRR